MSQVSPLRRRVIEDMTVRNLSLATADEPEISSEDARGPNRCGCLCLRLPLRPRSANNRTDFKAQPLSQLPCPIHVKCVSTRGGPCANRFLVESCYDSVR